MRTKRSALRALMPLVVLLGAVGVYKATQPTISLSLCRSMMGDMSAYTPSDHALYASGSSRASTYTAAQVAALRTFVAAHRQRPLAVVDRAVRLDGLDGPVHDTTAFIFDTGTVAEA